MPFAPGFSSAKIPQNTTVCVGALARGIAVAAAGVSAGADAVGTDAGAATGLAAHAPSATPNMHVAIMRSGFLVCIVGGLYERASRQAGAAIPRAEIKEPLNAPVLS